MKRIILADDHRVLVDGISKIIEEQDDLVVVGKAHHGEELLALLKRIEADLVVLDINMPGKSGMDICQTLRQTYPSLQILILSMHQDAFHVQTMLQKGANGYITKNSTHSEMLLAIRTVASGNPYLNAEAKYAQTREIEPDSGSDQPTYLLKLSNREKEVLRLIVEEYTTQEIADQLFISIKTVETHRRNLLSKLNARNTAGLVRIAVENGLV
ncbi:MAG: response regulator transcription factor [Bacteroidota bacterium]